jgi:hypothetical protein
MAKQRYINTKFWSDTWISDLDPVEKLLFLYLLTNERTNICGIYELPLKIMSVESGIEKEMIERILRRFEKHNKVVYRNGWVKMINFIKHQDTGSEKIKQGIDLCLKLVPKDILDTLSIPYPYPSNYSNSNSNTNNNSNSNNILATPSVAEEKINLNPLIELFKEVNPSYKRLYSNTTQRACLGRLVKENGLEKIEWVLKVLPKTNTMQYFPVITTPQQLENKFGQLKAMFLKEKVKLEDKNNNPKYIKL